MPKFRLFDAKFDSGMPESRVRRLRHAKVAETRKRLFKWEVFYVTCNVRNADYGDDAAAYSRVRDAYSRVRDATLNTGMLL